MTRPVTAESLSDDEILRFGRSHMDGTANDAIARHLTVVALGLWRVHDRDHAEAVNEARARIAAAINARNGGGR